MNSSNALFRGHGLVFNICQEFHINYCLALCFVHGLASKLSVATMVLVGSPTLTRDKTIS